MTARAACSVVCLKMGDEAVINNGQVALSLIGEGVGIQRAVDRPASMSGEESIRQSKLLFMGRRLKMSRQASGNFEETD